MDESLYKKTWLTFNLSSLKIVAFNQEAKTAACSSTDELLMSYF